MRIRALGRKGQVTSLMKGLGSMTADERKMAGPALNALKDRVGSAIEARREALKDLELEARLAGESLDLSLPVRPQNAGRIHPVSQVTDELTAIFADMGFTVAEGPDVETDFYNFTALNIPPEHPARQMHDTFYFPERADGSRLLLRTHTSPVQIRIMQNAGPPIRIIAPGRTYRCDSDITHTPMFHQVEGLLVGEGVTMADLKGTLEAFLRELFDPDTKVMFRPSFFPYTEPSAEVFIGCLFCDGKGCGVCKKTGWLEILGSGMVHAAVFEAVGYDPERYTGWAFGLGIERVAMLKYRVDDIRLFYENDLRFLEQFPA